MFGATLHEALDAAAAKFHDVAVIFPTESSRLTLPELSESSVVMANALLQQGVAPGDRVGVLCPNEPAFLRAVFAVSRTGAASCPLPLPGMLRDLESYAARLGRVIAVAGIRRIVVTDDFRDLVDVLTRMLPEVSWLRAGDLRGAESLRRLPAVSPGDLAIVQFTSGRPQDLLGIWLPMYHDMGLFGSLTALLAGVPVMIWSPISFVKNPSAWLRTVSEHGNSICPLPNFGYDYLVAAVSEEDAPSLNLSRWRIAFNGAEQVCAGSVEAFQERFAPAGFRPEAMMPVYGMAEATLAVTFPPLGRPPVFDWVDAGLLAGEGRAVALSRTASGARAVAGLGQPVPGMRVRLADRATGRQTGDRQVGEIQVTGPAVTSGYLSGGADGGDITQPFTADGWLRTGDLGYTDRGELYVTGRTKEMIIVRGGNYHPEDVESVAREVPGVYRRRCAAFADTADGRERMVLAAETRVRDEADRVRLVAEIKAGIAGATGLAEVAVHLVPPQTIPRTTSGKLQRLAMPDVIRSLARAHA